MDILISGSGLHAKILCYCYYYYYYDIIIIIITIIIIIVVVFVNLISYYWLLVPSEPVILVKGRNTSHTSLFVQWDEIPRDSIHGVLLGYRVLFWRYNESRDTYETKQLGTNERSVHLKNLWIYTKYKIQVLGFTAVGEGAISKEIIVSTDEYSEFT